MDEKFKKIDKHLRKLLIKIFLWIIILIASVITLPNPFITISVWCAFTALYLLYKENEIVDWYSKNYKDLLDYKEFLEEKMKKK